jgi:dienelactone hydrolase
MRKDQYMKILDKHAPISEGAAEPRRSRRRGVRTAVISTAAVAAFVATTAGITTSASAVGFERGPAPTTASIEASTGPFAVAKTTASGYSGFGGGTIYYPTATDQGTFGAVVVTPGYTERQSDMAWYGNRIASQGFVVFTIDTTSTLSSPDSRASQMQAAMDYLTQRSSVTSRVDGSRTAYMGHSMGGGGSLRAAAQRPQTKAIIPLTPYHTDKTWSEVKVPTLIVAAENDSIAPKGSHAQPFYNSIPSTTKKAYLELNGASHLAPTSSNTTIAKFSIAWLKRWVDSDTRYSPFLCNISTSSTIQTYNSNCPF